MAEPRRAVVVGGGLGGLAAALALLKVGFDVQVFEKRSGVSGGEGTMVVLAPNGLRALSRIHDDLVPQLLALGCPSPTVVVHSLAGEETARQAMGRTGGDPAGKLLFEFPFLAIAWSAVLRVLRGALPPKCLHPGHTLKGLEQNEGSITATFDVADEGTKRVEADVLIGADGIWSVCRQLLFGLGPESVVDVGRTIWRAMGPWAGHPLPLAEKGGHYYYMGPKVNCSVSDPGNDQLYFAFGAADSAWEGGQAKRSKDEGEMTSALKELFRDCPPAQRIIEALPETGVLERRVLECPVLEVWAKGSAVLIGDAAHAVPPTIGQGANLAFEDAWDLACFLQHEEAISDAVRKFEACRIPRVRGVADINRQTAANAYKEGISGSFTWDSIWGYQGAFPPESESLRPVQP